MDSIWLRAETKPFERRTPLVPNDAKRLMASGTKVFVERSKMRIYPDEDYSNAGCALVEAGSWVEAPSDVYILGVKELPLDTFPIKHRHIYFAHAYKKQEGGEALLERFRKGGGVILDLEYLVDEEGKRVASFGYWAGMAGAAISLLVWTKREIPDHFLSVDAFFQALQLDDKPRALQIGFRGKTARGVQALFQRAGIDIDQWSRIETAQPELFEKILSYDMFFNCILVREKITPFLTREMLKKSKRLSIVCDVSCDVGSPFSPLPIYDQLTSFKNPTVEVEGVQVIAIDQLPTFFPKESSDAFSQQLLPFLTHFDSEFWERVRKNFREA